MFSKLVKSTALVLKFSVLALSIGVLTGAAVEKDKKQVKKQYVMGVFPYLPPRDLDSVFAPIVADLGVAVKKSVTLRSNSTFQRFRDSLDAQKYDIAFLQPFDYVRAADRYGYIPLATRKEMLAAVLVVTNKSPLKSLKDLEGKMIALPPRTAAVSHLTKALLRAHGYTPGKKIKVAHFRSHVSCMQQVVIGIAAACGTAAPAKRFFEFKMSKKMRIIAKSKEIPHTLFAVHPRVPKKERAKILKRILSWGNSKAGRKMLSRGRLKPFRVISDADYNVVREMRKKR